MTDEAPEIETPDAAPVDGAPAAPAGQTPREAAIEALRGIHGGDEAPAVEPVVTPAAPPAPPVEPETPLEQRLRAKAAERHTRDEAAAQSAEMDRLRALEAAVKAGGHKPVDRAAIEAELVGQVKGDLLGFLRAQGIDPKDALRTMSQAVLNPEVASVHQELAALKAQLAGAPKPTEQQDPAAVAYQVYEQQQARASAEAEFGEACSAKNSDDAASRPGEARFALASKMAPDMRVARGDAIAREFQKMGVPVDMEQIAEILEGRLEAQYREITGEEPPHLRTTAAQSGTTPAIPRRAARTAATPSVLTNQLAAAGGSPRAPQTIEERRSAAREALRRATASG